VHFIQKSSFFFPFFSIFSLIFQKIFQKFQYFFKCRTLHFCRDVICRFGCQKRLKQKDLASHDCPNKPKAPQKLVDPERPICPHCHLAFSLREFGSHEQYVIYPRSCILRFIYYNLYSITNSAIFSSFPKNNYIIFFYCTHILKNILAYKWNFTVAGAWMTKKFKFFRQNSVPPTKSNLFFTDKYHLKQPFNNFHFAIFYHL